MDNDDATEDLFGVDVYYLSERKFSLKNRMPERISILVEQVKLLEELPNDIDNEDARSEDTESEEEVEEDGDDESLAELKLDPWNIASDQESLLRLKEKQSLERAMIQMAAAGGSLEDYKRRRSEKAAKRLEVEKKQAEPTHGTLPAAILAHIRFPKQTNCLATWKFAFTGTPFPLTRSQLITLIVHYGGQHITLQSVPLRDVVHRLLFSYWVKIQTLRMWST